MKHSNIHILQFSFSLFSILSDVSVKYSVLTKYWLHNQKLLGRLCEQSQILKNHEAVVYRLRMDKVNIFCNTVYFKWKNGLSCTLKTGCHCERGRIYVGFLFCYAQENLEEALVATHQEMELYQNQPLAMEKLQFKKETLQNRLINIRGELSQASSVWLPKIYLCVCDSMHELFFWHITSILFSPVSGFNYYSYGIWTIRGWGQCHPWRSMGAAQCRRAGKRSHCYTLGV